MQGSIWKFYLKKIYPPAPDDIDIPIKINYRLEVSATPVTWDPIYGRAPYAIAAITYIQQGITWWYFSLNTQNNNPDSITASYYSSARLLEQQELTITAITDTNCPYIPGQPFEGSLIAYAKIDPEVIIDPTFTVNINGVNYPANQLYRVEFSPNLFPSPAPWLNLLLGD